MLNALKSLFRQQPVAMVPEVTKEKLFKACRGILRVNGCKLLDPPDIGFKLRVDRSKLLGAGFGVFVQEGRIYKGDVVSLYSGAYFPPPPLWSVATMDGDPVLKPFQINKTLSTNTEDEAAKEAAAAYQIHCNQMGGYLDGIQYTPYADEDTKNGSAVARVDMPYSSAQLINHPGPGIMPNVVNIDFDWSEYLDYIASTDEDLNMEEEKKRIEQINKIGTGIWFYDTCTNKTIDLSPDCAHVAGIVTVAQRDIEAGEEIYLDYKYHEDDMPVWYTPVPAEEVP